MYSSAIAPSRHFATVTIRPPPSNSPTTHVQSPDPNLTGWDVIWMGVPPAVSTKRPHGIDVLLDPMGLGLPVDIYKNVVGMVVGEHAVPVGAVPSHEVELIHALEVAGYLVIRHH